MKEFDPHISINSFKKAKDSYYCNKEIEIDNLKIKLETPYKVIEGKKINKDSFDTIIKNIKKPIFESERYVAMYKSWNRLHYLLNEAEEDKIRGLDSFLDIRKDLWDSSLTTTSFVFSRNPFVENRFGKSEGEIKKLPALDADSYDTLLDYIHTASSALVLTPDIKIRGNEIITLDEYLKFVDNSIKVLSEFNKKAIFAPIQTHLLEKRSRKILEHYKKQGYVNIWVNFNASHIGGTYFARVRTLLKLINNIIGLENVTLYFSHIKKEINPHIKDEQAVGSDILSQFFAADFMGVNREPLRVMLEDTKDDTKIREKRMEEFLRKKEFNNEEDYKKAIKLNRSRVFDPTSYYYQSTDNYPYQLPLDKELLLNNIEINKLLNSFLIHAEVEKTKNFVGEQKNVKSYLKNKKALKENKDVFEGIIDPQSGIYDFLGKL